jgi:glutathione synthase/RimK-type ligase-like ATP-grasp enzyme
MKYKAFILCRPDFGGDSVFTISGYMKNNVPVILNKEDTPPQDATLCIRWGCTGSVPQKSVLNTAKSIHLGFNKPLFRSMLWEHGLAPKYFQHGEAVYEQDLPVLVRPEHHTQGKDAYLCKTLEQIGPAVAQCGHNYYVSKYIEKIQEFRVFVIQGRVVFIMEKFPNSKNDIAWDFSPDSEWGNVKWSKWNSNVLSTAVNSMKISGLDFGGVDVVVDESGAAYALEINSAAGVYGNYMANCVAKAFDWIIDSGDKSHIPVCNKKTNYPYLNFIHPAIESGAYV